mmetsp:Transcript_40269/g.104230  ORF Transcript_40269/g.104230 Transcript_40269/m.104230 type:complete len:209 (+) Transcript_40269:159-785(+)
MRLNMRKVVLLPTSVMRPSTGSVLVMELNRNTASYWLMNLPLWAPAREGPLPTMAQRLKAWRTRSRFGNAGSGSPSSASFLARAGRCTWPVSLLRGVSIWGHDHLFTTMHFGDLPPSCFTPRSSPAATAISCLSPGHHWTLSSRRHCASMPRPPSMPASGLILASREQNSRSAVGDAPSSLPDVTTTGLGTCPTATATPLAPPCLERR